MDEKYVKQKNRKGEFHAHTVESGSNPYEDTHHAKYMFETDISSEYKQGPYDNLTEIEKVGYFKKHQAQQDMLVQQALGLITNPYEEDNHETTGPYQPYVFFPHILLGPVVSYDCLNLKDRKETPGLVGNKNREGKNISSCSLTSPGISSLSQFYNFLFLLLPTLIFGGTKIA